MIRKLFFVLIGLIFISNSTYASPTEGSWELGPYGGYGFLDDYSGANPKNGYLFGVRLGYFVTPTVSFEPSYQWLLTKTRMPAPATNQDGQIRSLRFNFLYNFLPDLMIRP